MPFSLTWESNFISTDGTISGRSGPSKIIYNSNGIPTGDATSPKLPIHALSPDQAKYMQQVTKAAKSQGTYTDLVLTTSLVESSLILTLIVNTEVQLRQLREHGMYEEPMFWCSQLFLPGWEPPVSPSPMDIYHDTSAYNRPVYDPHLFSSHIATAYCA